jgi:hypothetical protein
MEVNMSAIHCIWLAFVALSTVFAASLWTTIFTEFWRANRSRALAKSGAFPLPDTFKHFSGRREWDGG